MVAIIILAMLFLFVGLRLWSVLGRRTGHEQTTPKPVEVAAPAAGVGRPTADPAPALPAPEPAVDQRAADG